MSFDKKTVLQSPLFRHFLLIFDKIRHFQTMYIQLFKFHCCYLLEAKEFSEKDIAKSLLHMISNDIGQVSFDVFSQLCT